MRRRPGSVPPPRGSARNCRPRGRAAPAAPPPPGLRRPATEFKATGASQPRGAPQSFPEAPAVPAPGPYPRELPLRGEGPLVRPVPPPRPRAREPHGNQLPTGAHPHRLGRLPGPRCLALSGLPRGPHLSDLSCGPDPTALQVGSSVALWLESGLPFTARAGRWRVFWLRLPSRFSGILIPVRTKIWCWRGGPFQVGDAGPPRRQSDTSIYGCLPICTQSPPCLPHGSGWIPEAAGPGVGRARRQGAPGRGL